MTDIVEKKRSKTKLNQEIGEKEVDGGGVRAKWPVLFLMYQSYSVMFHFIFFILYIIFLSV